MYLATPKLGEKLYPADSGHGYEQLGQIFAVLRGKKSLRCSPSRHLLSHRLFIEKPVLPAHSLRSSWGTVFDAEQQMPRYWSIVDIHQDWRLGRRASSHGVHATTLSAVFYSPLSLHDKTTLTHRNRHGRKQSCSTARSQRLNTCWCNFCFPCHLLVPTSFHHARWDERREEALKACDKYIRSLFLDIFEKFLYKSSWFVRQQTLMLRSFGDCGSEK